MYPGMVLKVGSQGEPRRVCLLTGASGALGTAFCRKASGIFDIIALYNENLPQTDSQELSVIPQQASGASDGIRADPVFAVRADLTKPADRQWVIEVVAARYGTVDLLVHAAAFSVWSPLLTSNEALQTAAKQFETNVIVPLSFTTEVARRFWRSSRSVNAARRTHVMTVSSVGSVRVVSGRGQSVYAASKAALNMATLHLSEELKLLSVKVNAVLPDSFPRLVPTDAVVEAMLKLDSANVTGQLVEVTKETCRPT